MLIALISSLLCLFPKLSFIASYFLYVLPVVLFTLSGPWFKIVMVLCGVTMAYEMMRFLVMTLTWYLYSALSSTLYFGNHISETISNYTYCLFSSGSQSLEGTGEDIFSYLFTLPSSFTTLLSPELVTVALQDVEYPWDTQTSMFLLLCLLNALQVLFKVKQLLRNLIRRSVLRRDICEWQGVWEDMGRFLGQWAPPVFWTFTPEQLQNPKKLVECLKKRCHDSGSSKVTQITVACWGLACAYRAAIDATINLVTDPAATPTSAATPTPTMDPVAPPASAASPAQRPSQLL